MPNSRCTITAEISDCETPDIVMESLIHSVTPCRNVPTPRVTISEWMRKIVIKRPLIRPITAPAASAAMIDQPMPTPLLTFSTAISIEERVMV